MSNQTLNGLDLISSEQKANAETFKHNGVLSIALKCLVNEDSTELLRHWEYSEIERLMSKKGIERLALIGALAATAIEEFPNGQ